MSHKDDYKSNIPNPAPDHRHAVKGLEMGSLHRQQPGSRDQDVITVAGLKDILLGCIEEGRIDHLIK